jgi:hypothetical protein
MILITKLTRIDVSDVGKQEMHINLLRKFEGKRKLERSSQEDNGATDLREIYYCDINLLTTWSNFGQLRTL